MKMPTDYEFAFLTTNTELFLKNFLMQAETNNEIFFWVFTRLGKQKPFAVHITARVNSVNAFDFDMFVSSLLKEENTEITGFEKIKLEKWYMRVATQKGMGIRTEPGFYSHKGFISASTEYLDHAVILRINPNDVLRGEAN